MASVTYQLLYRRIARRTVLVSMSCSGEWKHRLMGSKHNAVRAVVAWLEMQASNETLSSSMSAAVSAGSGHSGVTPNPHIMSRCC